MLAYPHASITNGGLTLHVYLPDPTKGFYRSTRFDWSGMVGWAECGGHTYFGAWRTPHDPSNYEHGVGTCEEFGLEGDPPLFAEAPLGSPFVKIGVGVLKKTTEKYDFKEPYPILRAGEWETVIRTTSIQFQQKLSEGAVGYEYTKTISLLDHSTGFRIHHALRNVGTLPLDTAHYSHAFIRIDDQPIDEHYEVRLPFDSGSHDVTIEKPGYATVNGPVISLLKAVDEGVRLWTPLHNWDAKDVGHSAFTVLNKASGVGLSMAVDRAPCAFNFYAEKTAACPEPFIPITVPPGSTAEWTSEWIVGVPYPTHPTASTPESLPPS